MTAARGIELYRVAVVEGLSTAEGFMRPLLFTEHVALIHLEIPPGMEVPAHGHPRDGQLYCINGTIELTFDGERCTVTAGCALFVPANIPCGLKNPENTSAECLLISAPPVFRNKDDLAAAIRAHSK